MSDNKTATAQTAPIQDASDDKSKGAQATVQPAAQPQQKPVEVPPAKT